MKRLIQFFGIVVLLSVSTSLYAQTATPITIKDLNTYEGLTEFSENAIEAHPLTGQLVEFTAVITSYPKSSGLANPDDDEPDGIIDDIGRVHIFVTDTNAVAMGREGMSFQIVESDYRTVDFLGRGSVVTFTGDLGFFGGTAQFDVETVNLLGTVQEEFPHLAELIEPWEVSLSEINSFEDGVLDIVVENYSKYNGAYVKITDAIVSNVSEGERPNWAINKDNSRIYVYDTSLRFRNDHAFGAEGYLFDYNARRLDSLDGDFTPPAPGANIDLSGYINYVGDDPDGIVGDGAFSINPFEDGVVWLNGNRFVDGDMVDGELFEWPNDVVINGLPPVISNVALSDSAFLPSSTITVSANVEAVDGATVTTVRLAYIASGVLDTLTMSNTAGNTYEATFPSFNNFTPVSFQILADDDNGISGISPIAGSYSFIIKDGDVMNIATLQETGDGSTGASPLVGEGVLDLDITATVVASVSEDGILVVQDNTEAWSGIFLEVNETTETLVRGDVINLTLGEVVEQEVSDFGLSDATVTQLINTAFTVESSGADIELLIPSLNTTEFVSLQANAEIEAYEAMVVKFENAKLVSVDSFGEFQIANLAEGETEYPDFGAIINEDMRLGFGDTDFPGDANTSAKEGVVFDAVYGIVSPAFGNGLVHPRGIADIIADNWANPSPEFDLLTPGDSAVVIVEADIAATWQMAEDYDGNTDIKYIWNLFSADTTTLIASVASDSDSTETTVSLPFEVVDGLLSDLVVGQSANFVWNVTAISEGDTTNSEDYFRIILTRGNLTSTDEDNSGVPMVYSLEQNYPNPFNPSTNIEFALPQSSRVTLTVFDMLGRRVATLIDGQQMEAANHSVRFDASALASGMYIYRIEAGTFNSTRKMMLIK